MTAQFLLVVPAEYRRVMVRITKEGNTITPGPWYLFGWKCPECGCEWDAEHRGEIHYERAINWGVPEAGSCYMDCPWCGNTTTHPKWR